MKYFKAGVESTVSRFPFNSIFVIPPTHCIFYGNVRPSTGVSDVDYLTKYHMKSLPVVKCPSKGRNMSAVSEMSQFTSTKIIFDRPLQAE